MPERIHCRVRGCGWSTIAEDFQDGMRKLRRHRKEAHPAKHRASIRKGVETRARRRRGY